MVAIQKDCLDPNYCDELGMTAAEIIVSDLCKSEYYKKRYQDPILMCRKASTATCEGCIYKEIKRIIEDTNNCAGLNDDIANLSTNLLPDLQEQCEEQVYKFIGWA